MRSNRKSYAMGLFLVTLLVLGSVSASLVYTTSQNMIDSRSYNGKVNSRNLANSVTELAYSSVIANPSVVDAYFNQTSCNTLTDISQKNSLKGLICPNNSSNLKSYNDIKNYLVKYKNDTISPCNLSSSDSCFAYYLTRDKNISGRLNSINIYSIIRSGCNTNGERCRITTFKQVVRPIQFFDYLLYTKYNLLDPTLYNNQSFLGYSGSNYKNDCGNNQKVSSVFSRGCVLIPLNQYDSFNGEIYTYDDYFVVCGFNPSNKVISKNNGTSGRNFNEIDPTSNCTNTTAAANFNNTNTYNIDLNLQLKGGDNCAQSSNCSLVSSINALKNGPSRSYYQFQDVSGLSVISSLSGTNTIYYSSNTVEINLSSGTYSGTISVVSDGDIIINSNVKKANSSSALSLIAKGSIKFRQNLQNITCTSDGSLNNREVDAYLVAINKSIQVENWDNLNLYSNIFQALFDPDPASPCTGAIPTNFQPTLKIFGAIVSKYQPVFGLYDFGDNQQTVLSGYKKDFRFDSSLRDGTLSVPFVVPPTITQWRRLTITEINSKIV